MPTAWGSLTHQLKWGGKKYINPVSLQSHICLAFALLRENVAGHHQGPILTGTTSVCNHGLFP